MSTDLNDLSLLLDSKVPILVIESSEEPRVLEMITGLAVQRTLPYFTWSITEGLNRLGFGVNPEPMDSPAATAPDRRAPGRSACMYCATSILTSRTNRSISGYFGKSPCVTTALATRSFC